MNLPAQDLFGQGYLADMEIEIGEQAAVLLLSLLMGLLMGIAYDMLRPLRRHLNRLGAVLCDLVFSITVFALVFSFAMGAGSGRVGQWELFGMLLGFLLYIYLLSPVFMPVFALWAELAAKLEIVIKKAGNLKKLYFQNERK